MIINSRLKLLTCALLTAPVLVSCGSGDSAFGEGAQGDSSSNVISARNFSVGFGTPAPEVLTLLASPGTAKTTPCSNLVAINGGPTSTITVTAADKDNALVGAGTVYFEVEWGTLDTNQCQLTDGQCSVNWSANTNIDQLTDSNTTDCLFNDIGTLDIYNAVTVWTYGEEGFIDNNGDGLLSGTETFSDVDEPFLDRNDNGSFDATLDNIVGPDTNGVHDGPDGVFNGPSCDPLTRSDCGSVQLIPIYEGSFMILYTAP